MHCHGLDTRLGDGRRGYKGHVGNDEQFKHDYGLDNNVSN